MKTLSPDTSPEMEKKWLALLRTLTPEQRLMQVIRLNNRARAFQIAGIRFRHPDADEQEIKKANGLWQRCSLSLQCAISDLMMR